MVLSKECVRLWLISPIAVFLLGRFFFSERVTIMGQFDQRNDSLVQGANTGVQAFMSQVYGWMTVGLLLTAFVAWYSVSSGLYYTIATNKILFWNDNC